MNIFALNSDPILAAQNHVDRHVVKMPLETSQILCTVVRGLGGEADISRLTKTTPVPFGRASPLETTNGWSNWGSHFAMGTHIGITENMPVRK